MLCRAELPSRLAASQAGVASSGSAPRQPRLGRSFGLLIARDAGSDTAAELAALHSRLAEPYDAEPDMDDEARAADAARHQPAGSDETTVRAVVGPYQR